MSTLKRPNRIAQLEDKLRQLKERQQAVEARQRTLDSRRKRKDDTRRKILVGAIVLAKVEQGELDAAQLRGWLDTALSRADDRGLFQLDQDVATPGESAARVRQAGGVAAASDGRCP